MSHVNSMKLMDLDKRDVRRSSTFLQDNEDIFNLLPDQYRNQSFVQEYRPIADVYEVESYKEYNRIQYAEVLRQAGYRPEGASLRDHAMGFYETGKEIVEDSCVIF